MSNIKVNEEEAVSPVFGEVLMVAVVLIIGAIIAAFLLGGPMQPPKPKFMAASAERMDADHVVVTFHGGEGMDQLMYLSIMVGEKRYCTHEAGYDEEMYGGCVKPDAGDSWIFEDEDNNWPDRVHVVVATNFYEAKDNAVILDKYV